MHPKYRWSSVVITGMVQYAQFHLREIVQKRVRGEKGPWTEYTMALQTFVADLKEGHYKKCMAHKELGYAEKAREDLKALKKFPMVKTLQDAVAEGYMTLKMIADKYEGTEALPRLARGAANAAISGAIHFDTFGGRKWEWEHCDYDYICNVLDSDQRYIVCQQHKTYKTYGDLANKIDSRAALCIV